MPETNEREALARALWTAKGFEVCTLHQHHEWEDWPTDERTEHQDFDGKTVVTLLHFAWRKMLPQADAILASDWLKAHTAAAAEAERAACEAVARKNSLGRKAQELACINRNGPRQEARDYQSMSIEGLHIADAIAARKAPE